MHTSKQTKKANTRRGPIDLNRNGKIDPFEAALIMTIIDDVNEDNQDNQYRSTQHKDNDVVDIDDLDIEGI